MARQRTVQLTKTLEYFPAKGNESIETTMVYLKVFQPEIREQLSKVQFI
jgi:hypothetical protein